MTTYNVRGSNVFLGSELDGKTFDHLPAANYALNFNPELGFFLTRAPEFSVPSRLYGNTESMAKRFLATFTQRKATTGVLLSGEKGSGKSLVMKLTAMMAIDAGIPVVIISAPYQGPGFNSFIQSITDPCVVLFDEFEKVYDRDAQKSLLTLFDGAFVGKKLMILTSNDKWAMDENFRNRPGRLYYGIDYAALPPEFVEEYCVDRLKDQNAVGSVVACSKMFRSFNFDMMAAIVEEMNRYGESVKQVLDVLNITTDLAKNVYDVKVQDPSGATIKKERHLYCQRHDNPLTQEQILIELYRLDEDGDANSRERTIEIYPQSDRAVIEDGMRRIIVKSDDGYTVTFVRREESVFDYRNLL